MYTKTIIFPASRFINHREKNEILLKTTDFLKNWKAHGKPLEANASIEYQQFIIIRVDENIEPASGCSLDALNNFMREIEQKYQLGLFDRMKAIFLENNIIKTLKLKDFRNDLKNKKSLLIFSFLIFHQIMKKNFQKDFYCP